MGGNWGQRIAGDSGDTSDKVYADLRAILLKHGGHLDVSEAETNEITISGPLMERWKRDLWFGAVRVGKAYVSYHLMPVYMFPDLLETVSPQLRARMQGKSCFNFKRVDVALFAQLDTLTALSVQRLIQEGIL